jgi:GT2 family glycosyltransferase
VTSGAEPVELPPVTVVIPHLNQHEALGRCLASIAAQDYPQARIELIIVDNGSREPCDAVVARFPGARLLHEPAPGPGLARNAGVASASHAHLAFIDADCRADPQWLRTAMTALLASDSGVVGGDVRIDVVRPPHLTALEAYESVFAYRQKLYIDRDGFSGTGNLAMRRDVFDRVGPFAGIGIAEDYDWGRRARALGHPARYVPGMIVFHPARTTMAQLEAKWRRHIAHDLAERRARGGGGLKWTLKALAMLASIVPHSAKIALSPHVKGPGNIARGIIALAQIRWFRCLEMLRQARGSANAAGEWNR